MEKVFNWKRYHLISGDVSQGTIMLPLNHNVLGELVNRAGALELINYWNNTGTKTFEDKPHWLYILE